MYSVKLFISIIFCSVLCACADQKIVDDIKLVQTIGYDTVGNDVKSAVLFPVYEKKDEAKLQILDTQSNSYYDIIPRLNTKTNETIEYGQLRMVLFGKEYAYKGIDSVIHSLCRDARIGSRVQLGIAERDAMELLKLTEKFQVPSYLSSMIDQNIKSGNLPSTNLQQFLFNFYGEGRDPYLPYLIIERGKIKIDGLALFKHDKYITNISIREAFILKLLIDNSKYGSYLYPLKSLKNNNDDFILVHSIGSKAKFEVHSIQPVPSISIHVRMKTQIRDVPDQIDLTKKEQLAELEKSMETFFENEIQNLISLCKKYNVDPIGFGDLIRSKSKVWNEKGFMENYPKLKTKVSVKLDIIQTGVGE